MRKIFFFACAALMTAFLLGCGHKQPKAEVTSGSVFANEVPADTVESEPLSDEAYTVQVPVGWKVNKEMESGLCVLCLRQAPFTVATIETLPSLSFDKYVSLRTNEGCKQRSNKTFYGREFVVHDFVDCDANLIIRAATPLSDGVFVLTLEAGPQRLPMEETHAAMFDNMKTLLQNVIFN